MTFEEIIAELPKPYYQDDWRAIYNLDNRALLPVFADSVFDSVVTDPPYELGFMGKKWDNTGIAYRVDLWQEVLRVLKPGGHLLSFGGSRTYHRMACAIEDAGFEVRDMVEWMYSTGFPKSLDVSKAIDKTAGIWRAKAGAVISQNGSMSAPNYERTDKGEPVTPTAQQWEGWGTALKPAHEPICLARKPLSEKTVAENVLKWGTGGINIDASRIPSVPLHKDGDNSGCKVPSHILLELYDTLCTLKPFSLVVNRDWSLYPNDALRVKTEYIALGSQSYCPICRGLYDGLLPLYQECAQDVLPLLPDVLSCIARLRKESNDTPCHLDTDHLSNLDAVHAVISSYLNYTTPYIKNQSRFPANLIHDGSQEVMDLFPDSKSVRGNRGDGIGIGYHGSKAEYDTVRGFGDSGSAARFFYCAKASKSERDRGEEKGVLPGHNNHPTVKPIALMSYLIKLITPPNGIVLDPFMGSGSTLLACPDLGVKVLGIELDEKYCEIAAKRCSQSVKRLE